MLKAKNNGGDVIRDTALRLLMPAPPRDFSDFTSRRCWIGMACCYVDSLL